MPPTGNAEQLLGSLAGVVSAHIVREADGQIVEIHILATPDLHPKQVVRNVESALSAGLGIAIDRRIVSVAQIRTQKGDGVEGDPPAPESEVVPVAPTDDDPGAEEVTVQAAVSADRLAFVRFESRRDVEQCTCDVTLRDARDEYTGVGSGPDTAAGRAGAAADAVLAALREARPELRFGLDGVSISSARGRTFVIVSARVMFERESVPLSGAAIVHRSPEEAAILATLQATNRWSG